MNLPRACCCLILTGTLAVLATGCGGGEDAANRVETYNVSGTITMGGEPVADAAVVFSPQGDQPAATGRTNDQGKFTSLRTYQSGDGAAAGDYVVVVSKSSGGGPEIGHDPQNSESVDPAQFQHSEGGGQQGNDSEFPQKYATKETSDLTATVTADGDNTFQFELASGSGGSAQPSPSGGEQSSGDGSSGGG